MPAACSYSFKLGEHGAGYYLEDAAAYSAKEWKGFAADLNEPQKCVYDESQPEPEEEDNYLEPITRPSTGNSSLDRDWQSAPRGAVSSTACIWPHGRVDLTGGVERALIRRMGEANAGPFDRSTGAR